eukprot:Gb_04144 [translate_table: standard]
MASTKPLRTRRKKMVLFLAHMLHFYGDASALRRGYANVSNISPVDFGTLCKRGRLKEALDSLHVMGQQSIRIDIPAYTSLLRGCIDEKSLSEGKLVHAHMTESGFMLDLFLGNTLVNMYTKCGSLVDARRVLDKMPKRNVVSWTVMIAAYVSHGFSKEGLALFYEMQRTGIQPNEFTFASILPACANLADLERGKEVHEEIRRSGFQSDVFVGSALVDMYVKCGNIEDARHVFDKMPERNVVSWNALMAGYVQNGHGEEALALFHEMLRLGIQPNEFTFATILPACANLAALEHGKGVHEEIIRSGFISNVFVGSALVDMYAKCGSIENALQVFATMPKRDVVIWNAMIVGYSKHGCAMEALQLFEQMQHSDTVPDDVTFVGVLSSCCHAGLVDDGWQYFHSMSRRYNITPAVEHYSCMVDLLGRSGRLNEAQDLINKMEMKPNAAVWGSLLCACRIHANIELGKRAAERLFELDPTDATPYVLLSNIYAAAGRWDDIQNVRKMMKERSIKKKPGCSWIEVNKQVYVFLGGDTSHPQIQEIHAKLDKLSGQMREAGYVPDKKFVLSDVEEEQKEHLLCHHSEKLAIAFGLLNVPPGTPIRIIKNLRVCGDCHSAIKFISMIVAREIVVRDANRFHHFKYGQCSCGDYW